MMIIYYEGIMLVRVKVAEIEPYLDLAERYTKKQQHTSVVLHGFIVRHILARTDSNMILRPKSTNVG